MERSIGVLWFRNDLRVHDNEALMDAISHVDDVYPVYVFDERMMEGKTPMGFDKTGPHRIKFLIESVSNLKDNLKKLGSDLFIYYGKPEEVVFEIVQKTGANWVFCNRERTSEEVFVQDRLEKNLWTIGRELRFYRGKMLFYTADLPFPVTQTPDTFTQFRKEVERFVPIRQPLAVPKIIPTSNLLKSTGISKKIKSLFSRDTAGFPFKGGESEAIRRLEYYLWDSDLVSNYKETRNGLLGQDYSSKFSAWLSLGCISPKLIYSEVKRYETERSKNKSTYWLIFELIWRDYFRFIAKKHGNKIFQKGGITDIPPDSEDNFELFERWCKGETGIPFIDANMKELNQTGFMSNRGRQNVASFLIHDLKINWTWGAEYFESLLVDYDPCSNYGNWNYLAGVGTDPRSDRYFKVLSQAKRYDPNGEFVRKWIPELRTVSDAKVHWPHLNSLNTTFDIPEIYKNPVVELEVPE
ncbi:MAG: DASH family cryptochrome [Saprospirales bacterium]|nr:MAG: DASH family cryptochrome [Saprospirales bacterium]